jgi:4-diphosphocytidyl-2-C-methyl-D-erythritol kinase
MIRFPNCKINLGLHVLEKLPDGYHRIETAFYPIGLSDILEVNPSVSGQTHLTITGIPIPGDTRDNLCYRAWELLNLEYGIQAVEMHLHKIIPTGAGLGGGSSDAAAVLLMLNELFAMELSPQKLHELATQLGMDCPYFLLNAPAIGSGKGELLSPIQIELKGFHLVVAIPGIPVSTAEAYSGVIPKLRNSSLAELLQLPVEAWKHELINDFEESVFFKHPEIGMIKEEFYRQGAVYASMSGSGSALYGIFREKIDLAGRFEGCFLWNSPL